MRAGDVHRLLAVRRFQNLVAEIAQNHAGQVSHVFLILHHQHGSGALGESRSEVPPRIPAWPRPAMCGR